MRNGIEFTQDPVTPMSYQAIDIDAGKELIDNQSAVIVDVRDSNAYQSAHIRNAHLLNETNVQKFIESTDKSVPLLVYCYHGHSSRGAAEYLVAAGFEDVYSLDGGFEAWRNKYPTES